MNKKDFDDILKKINLSRQEFANKTGLSYGAVGNWNDESKPVPSWVESWLENYIKAKDIEKIAEAVKSYIK